MKKWFVVVLIALMLALCLSGCTFLRGLVDQADPNSLVGTGSTLQDAAPIAGAFNPALSILLYMLGGVLVGGGNLLKHYKEKK